MKTRRSHRSKAHPVARSRPLRLEPLEQRTLLDAFGLSGGKSPPEQAASAVITVTGLADTVALDGVVTLREAVLAANTDSPVNEAPAGSGADTILFDPDLFLPGPQTLALAGAELGITDDLTITGPGQHSLTIDGKWLSRVLNIDDGSTSQIDVTLSDMTIRGGFLSGYGGGIANRETLDLSNCGLIENGIPDLSTSEGGDGGGIWNSGTLTITNSTVSDNKLEYGLNANGAGIWNSGTLTIANSTVSGNHEWGLGEGGGIWNSGTATITESTLSGNTSDSEGSGIWNSGTLTISNTTLSEHESWFDGGAILNNGTLTIAESTLSGNTAGDRGGGIWNSGTATITESTLSGNTSDWGAGGIWNSGTLTVTDSTLSGNEAGNLGSLAGGGGIWNSGAATITNTTLSGNEAFGGGGGICNRGTATITNSTLSGNSGGCEVDMVGGGGIYNSSNLTVTNSTVSGNTSDFEGGGVFNCILGTATMANSIIADNTALGVGPDVSGSLDSQGYNLIGNSSGASGFVPTDLLDADPLLGPLQDNGGPTWTHALLPGSPAIDAGDPHFDPAAFQPPRFTDQRGYNRVTDGDGDGSARIDIGACESNSSPMIVLVVNSTADPGDGTPDATETTLREALDSANATPGTQAIVFDIPASDPGYDPVTGAFSIQPLSALPEITDPVILDAWTQPGFAGTPIIELDGSMAGTNGLVITAGDSTVRGLVINRFCGSGIVLAANGNNALEGNYIGTDVTGTIAQGNGFGVDWGFGVEIYGGSHANRIGTDGDGVADQAERNLISGNSAHGIAIYGEGTDFNVVAGNYIGTDVSGTLPLANGLGTDWGNGVAVYSGAQSNRIGTNGDGLADAAERNVISGNNNSGVYFASSGTDYNIVAGNYLGTDASGENALGNGNRGVYLVDWQGGPQHNLIGTNGDGVADEAERNLISGNAEHGVFIIGVGTDYNVVAGNYIGTDVTGTQPLGNGYGGDWAVGVGIWDGAQSNRVGTDGNELADEAERNIISANSAYGVVIVGEGTNSNVVAGNYVGTDASGTAPLGNGFGTEWGRGIGVYQGAKSNRIGTDGNGVGDANERNVISANAQSGVYMSGSGTDYNVVAGNYIGTDASGDSALGNGERGVFLLDWEGGPKHNLIGTDGDGVADEAERNLISGNTRHGVFLVGAGTDHNVVAGNYIGTDVTGTQPLGNGYGGEWAAGVAIWSGAQSNRVGTDGDEVADEAERNVISANSAYGVVIGEVGTNSNVVAGNYIGTDASGTAPLGNGFGTEWGRGIGVYQGAKSNRIGTDGNGVGDANERNVISANAQSGIYIGSSGTEYNVVAGNYIGTDATGASALGNGRYGVYFSNYQGGPQHNLIGTDGDGLADEAERNVISANTSHGVLIEGAGTDENLVAGNHIGTDVTGTAALGNGGHGVSIRDGAAANRIGTDGDGVADEAERNVISANALDGVRIKGAGTDFNVVAGNYIGTDAAGSAELGNDRFGVGVANGARSNRIGTDGDGAADAAERNVISGNQRHGVLFYEEATSDNVAAGNYIGTDVTGTAAIANAKGGLKIHYASNQRIGGSQPGEGNLISGNQRWGIFIQDATATGNVVQGNLIGTDATGAAPLGNTGIGLRILHANGNTIGGAAEFANTIAFNTAAGVVVEGNDTIGNSIRANSIYANGALGIDLNDDGLTLNDPGDMDSGPNQLQNYPLIFLVVPSGSTRVVGSLNSTPNSEFTLDFYANTTPDPFGFDEGERWLGSTVVTTDASGDADFDVVLPSATTPGEAVTATATDADGNTSEFSPTRDYSSEYSSAVMLDGPFAYYRLGEAAGATTAVDETGVHHGTYVNDPTLEVPGALVTDPDTAVQLDATQYVEGTTMADYGSRMIDGFTLECWTQSFASTVDQCILGTANPYYTTNVQLSLHWDTRSMRLYFRDDDWDRYSVWFHSEGHNADIFDEEWHHLVFTYDPIPANPSDRFELYVDSVPQELEVQPGNDRPDGTSDFVYPMIMGGWHKRGTVIPTYDGDLDEVAFYTRPLSWTEVGEHYGAGVGNHVPMAIDDGYYVEENGTLLVSALGEVIAQAGFNDAAGIHSDPTPGSPYELGQPVNGFGEGEPGWDGPWFGGDGVVQDSVVFEGDLAAQLDPVASYYRVFTPAQTESLVVEQYVQFDVGARMVAYLERSAPTGEIYQGPVWQAFPDGKFYVVDGIGNGCIFCPREDTGFTWVRGQWYRVTVEVDVAGQTWEFFVDGQKYEAPDPLGFRGTPAFLDRLQYLSEGTAPAYLDCVTVAGPDPRGVLANDFDADGDPLEAILVDGPSHGTLDLNDDGSFTYTPDIGFRGVDGFTYKATDGQADSNVATVLIGVSPDIVVNSTADPGDGIPDATETTLREAIDAANAIPGTQTILFDIPTSDPGYNAGTGAYTIRPRFALPEITDPVILDAWTQPGFAGTPIIELDGSQAGTDGLVITTDHSTVRGLVINRFSANGIVVNGGSHNVIEGNYIGTDVTGTVALGNGECGVLIKDGSAENRIGTDGDGVADGAERNVISGNGGNGLVISGAGSDSNVVAGNYIGTDVTGTAALGNGFGVAWGCGIRTEGGAQSNLIGTDGDGLADEAERNVVSANATFGVCISGAGTDLNVVAGNFLGTDASGASALGNGYHGVKIQFSAQRNLVGTNGDGVADEAERNVISGNLSHGLLLQFDDTRENVVAGNFIGTDVTGTAALPNGSCGVAISNGPQSNLIGTDADGLADEAERNLISGNLSYGVAISGSTTRDNVVAGNFIGTDVTGTAAIGNVLGGIKIYEAPSQRIGGSRPGEGNLISGNDRYGIFIQNPPASGNVIQGNLIGTDASGTAPLGNASDGIRIRDADGNTIGGAAGLANTIAFNGGDGVGVSGGGTWPAWAASGADFASPHDPGYALEFDGVKDVVQIADSPTLHSDRQLTISGWFRVDSFDRTWQSIVWKGNLDGEITSYDHREYGVWVNSSGYLYLTSTAVDRIGVGEQVLATPSFIELGDWYHFAAVIDADAELMRIYVDGQPMAERAYDPSGIRDTAGPLWLGGNPRWDSSLAGATDDVRIWSVARTQSEIQPDMNRPLVGDEPGLVAYWNLDEGTGHTVFDQTANGNHGTLGATSIGNSIRANSIFANGALGIDLGNDGVTPNDPGDADTGPNNLQNFPVITAAKFGTVTRVVGTLNSTPNTEFRLDFYANSAADPSGHGEGERWLGWTPVTTDAAGDVAFDAALPSATVFGELITATATDPDGNTSEFSAATCLGAPVAVNDDYRVDENTVLSVSAADGVLANDWDLDGDDLEAALVDRPDHGTLTLQPDGSFRYAPEAGFVGVDTFTYRAFDGRLDSNPATVTITCEPAPPADPIPFYFSVEENDRIGGLRVANEDVIVFDGTRFRLLFDGSDVGLRSMAIDALAVISENEILMSFVEPGRVPGIAGVVDNSDLVKFTATRLGPNTAGTFELYFDGSDVGLQVDVENVDGVELLEDGRLVFSGSTGLHVPGTSGADEDLLAFTPTSLGPNTAGTWARYFDGSDVGLADEDVNAVAQDDHDNLLFSCTSAFALPDVAGRDEDVFLFRPTSLGPVTAGTFAPALYFDGSRHGLGRNGIEAIDLAPNYAPVADDDVYDAVWNQVLNVPAGQGVLAGDWDPEGDPLTAVLVDGPAHGTLVLGCDGSFTYVPGEGFLGIDQFTYRAYDGRRQSNVAEVTIRVTDCLGPIDFLELTDLDPSATDLWCRLSSTHNALLTLEARFDGPADCVQLTLCDGDLVELACCTPVDGKRRIDWQAGPGQTYYFKVSGTSSDVDLRLANLVQHVGTGVTVYGTDGEDQFQLDGAASRRVTVNGVEYHFDDAEVTSVTFDGGDADDTAVFHGSSAFEWVKLWPGLAKVDGDGFTLVATNFESVTADSGGGNDVVQLFDSPGADLFDAYADRAVMTCEDGAVFQADGYRYVHAYAGPGAIDTANLYDTTADGLTAYNIRFDATVLADGRHSSRMFTAGYGFFNRAWGFEVTRAVCEPGGSDVALIHDSPGSDVFDGYADRATMTYGDGNTVQADNFRYVHAYASSGAIDTANLYDTTADGLTSYNTTFNAEVLADGRHSSRMFTAGYGFFNRALGFEVTRAVCEPGGSDVALLFDSSGADVFEAYADRGTLTYADGTVVEAQDFRYLHAVARNGGLDSATLYDQTTTGTPYATTLVGYAGSSILYTGYHSGAVRVWDFDETRAALGGGDDRVNLYDDPDRVDHLVVPLPGDAGHAPAKAKFSNDRRQLYIDDFVWLWATTSEDFEDEADVDPAYADQVILDGNWVEL